MTGLGGEFPLKEENEKFFWGEFFLYGGGDLRSEFEFDHLKLF